MSKLSLRALSYIALISALLGVVLMSIRFGNLISFFEPLQITASGAEYESLYVVWKYINGLTVFVDHFEKPFAGTFYNWIYYVFYGEISDLILSIFNLKDAWLPTITKSISFIGLIYGSAAAFCCFSQVIPIQNADLKRLNLSFALFIFFGPLMGFFGVALAPDIWALAFDATAILVFLKYYEKSPLKSILLACLFAYLAWGFKQIFVFTPAVVGLYLLFRRDWKWLINFSIVMWAGWILTLFVGGEQYTKAVLLFGGTKVTLDPDRFMRNLVNGMPKLAVPIFGLLAILVGLFGKSEILNRSKRYFREWMSGVSKRPSFFALIGISVASAIAFPASAKQGAAENYYFTLSFFLCMLVVIGTAWLFASNKLTRPILFLMICGWLVNLIGVGSVLAGINGKISNFYIHLGFVTTQKCLLKKSRPEPIFIDHPYLSLPWMYPANEHFVVQTSYRWDRASGVKMKDGGLGGLMDRGYFSTLALNEERGGHYDGSDLSLYEPTSERCDGFVLYRKIKNP